MRHPHWLFWSAFWLVRACLGQESAMCLETSAPKYGRALEVRRITNDPMEIHQVNYYTFDCFSPDGRYLCYSGGGKVCVYDLPTDRRVELGQGDEPRWANNHNWLFHNTTMARGAGETGQLLMHDLDGGKTIKIGPAVGRLGETDMDDRWIYAFQDLKGEEQAILWRIPIRENATPEILEGVGGNKPVPNPKHPVVYSRWQQRGPFEMARAVFELDGRNARILTPMLQRTHQTWLGNGEYFVLGDGLPRGRRWDEPFPSNLHILANADLGDPGACGKSGRWLVGGGNGGRNPIRLADLRSGDVWQALQTFSAIAMPKEAGDLSGYYDGDPKGSPDGTKIAFKSTYDLIDGPCALVRATSTPGAREEITVIDVDSTDGFPETGCLRIGGSAINGCEVASYASKTQTSFMGVKRALFGTQRSALAQGDWVTPFENCLISEQAFAAAPKGSYHNRLMRTTNQETLARQMAANVYMAVVRLPDPPFLFLKDGEAILVPGENHSETCGYIVYRNGKPLSDAPIRPGSDVPLPGDGECVAVAVEWSQLRSVKSQPAPLTGARTLHVLTDAPDGFSWTVDQWRVDGAPVDEAVARQATRSVREIVHRYEGVIHRERYAGGAMTEREDINCEGKPTRRLTYTDGRLSRRDYYTNEGTQVSSERFDAEGCITEQIAYETADGKTSECERWQYEKGMPVQLLTTKGNPRYAAEGPGTYAKQGEKWVRLK